MSMQRTVTSLVLAPLAIAAVLFMPTPWLAALRPPSGSRRPLAPPLGLRC